jgi:DNA polymerase-3 subunit gamma/tau
VSIALARKYRPTTFHDLIGQDAVSQTLSLALDTNRLSHAYLFSGLRGSGKTSTARIFAKALICDKGESSNPCGVCSNCIMADESKHIDIIEMDGASNRKIDDIRELIEHTKYKPAIARYKIFIIDEVHMLTKEAFNALLKTLEEPPNFIKFILATTEPLKLPATILSRTQHFRFRKISQKTLQRHLEYILNLESISYEKEAISILARVGAGSVRDALTLLDQAIVYSKGHIDISTVTNMLGIIDPSILDRLIDAVLNKDNGAILEFLENADEFEAEMIIDELMLYLKEILLKSSKQIKPTLIDRFFRILADGKSLLHIGSSGEFVLLLTLFKMIESIDKQDINLEVMKESSTQTRDKQVFQKPILDIGKEGFKKLIAKLHNRNPILGDCFERNIKYISYSNNLLTWESKAKGRDRDVLKYQWGNIRMFAQEIFGVDIKIKNISKQPISIKTKTEADAEKVKSPIENCTKEKNKGEMDILQEPMILKAKELFKPKRIIVKSKKDENSKYRCRS